MAMITNAPTTGPKMVPRPPTSVISTISPDIDQCTSVSEAFCATNTFSEPAKPASVPAFDLQLDALPGVRFSVSADSGTGTLVTTRADVAPVTSASNIHAGSGQTSVLASSLFSVTDADGDAITQYAFLDTQGHGHWVINGVVQATNAEIDVAAANLSQVSYVFGPSGTTDTLSVRANDGTLWGGWTQFTAKASGDSAPTVSAVNVTATHGETSTLATTLFTASDPDGDTITQYGFWDTGGNGHWVVNGVAQAAGTNIEVSAANLSQVSYVFGPFGSTPDTLWVRANDGIAWGAWQPFNVTGESSSNATIASGATLELPGASNATVLFQSSTGTLKLDNSASFSGTVAGMTGSDAIDFANISFANVHTPTFSGNTTRGTLTVTDGTVTASVALLGNYMASTFTASSDGHGGTLVVDPPATQVSQLAQPQHA